MKKIGLIGSAFGHGAQIYTTSLGPGYLKEQYNLQQKLAQQKIICDWYKIVEPQTLNLKNEKEKGKNFHAVLEHSIMIFNVMKDFLQKQHSLFPVIIGGNHSAAIGTWSAIVDTLNAYEDFGLIWIDAHMDANNYETSPSKAYHGMPLSILLGRGDNEMLAIGRSPFKISPKHVVIIGPRSYEAGEAAFLHSKGVEIITTDEIHQQGIKTVFERALSIVSKAKNGFGISFDLDAIDPSEAPGVGSPETNGLHWKEVKNNLTLLFQAPQFKALEIAEFNPTLDKHNLTSDIIFETLCVLGRSL